MISITVIANLIAIKGVNSYCNLVCRPFVVLTNFQKTGNATGTSHNIVGNGKAGPISTPGGSSSHLTKDGVFVKTGGQQSVGDLLQEKETGDLNVAKNRVVVAVVFFIDP